VWLVIEKSLRRSVFSVRYTLRFGKQLSIEYTIPDSNMNVDEKNFWFVLRINERQRKEAKD
jgi:hypothetical protein